MTKAKTLLFIQDKLVSARVLPLLIIKYSEYVSSREAVLALIQEKFPSSSLIIRSSSPEEDTAKLSNA